MKVHYINILLFALPLNILDHNKNKSSIAAHHTPKISTTRLLCECESYAPDNYDSDPQMKAVMENFNKQTQQRFHEYDERMKTTRQKCKKRCDKEIQKIILKDKLEKELMNKFATLDTDIQSDAIPTCICEKSIADKVEKGCLRCAQNLGGIVAPSTGVLGEIAALAVYGWKTTEIAAATKAAIVKGATKGLAAGIEAGKEAVFRSLKFLRIEELGVGSWEPYITEGYYINVENLATVILNKRQEMCGLSNILDEATCEQIACRIGTSPNIVPKPPPGKEPIIKVLNEINRKAALSADFEASQVTTSETALLKAKNIAEVEAAITPYYTPIIASIVAIVVIILIMVIIYLILRYRRKKKMKKKLQYIKLLEE
ncbi:rifin PIR protein,putative [Plasmodium sp. DRC-Itaito]|nr:rifin PIR protein,putative [Plasmodium sp. DRC-Itaito]